MITDSAVAAAFAALARARGGVRALHPIGRAYEARLDLTHDAPVPLGPGTTHAAVARLSRATGLRAPLPDEPGRFLLVDAPPLGRWGAPWGELTLGAPLDATASAALRFHPWNAAPDLVPAGFVNALRRPSYSASQQARTEPRSSAPDH